MDNFNKERVLAYKKATELSGDELQGVSGGSSTFSHHEALKVTGNSSAPDVRYDQVIDW